MREEQNLRGPDTFKVGGDPDPDNANGQNGQVRGFCPIPLPETDSDKPPARNAIGQNPNPVGQNPNPVRSQPLPLRPRDIPLWGREPDPEQARRNRPVERDEVMINRAKIQTMPAGTYEPGKGKYRSWIPIPGLWGQFCEEMAEQDRRWQRRGLSGEPRSPEYWLRPFFSCAREYLCWQCGAVYLAEPSRSRKRLCSNRCERQLIAEYGREWRKRRAEKLARLGEKPIHNVGRSERRREERAKLCCEWCGVAIEAGRSSRRYCSEAHRIAAHRKRHRVDRRVTVMDKSFSGE